jgi:LCP family protein required for cell wall assembly
MPPRVPNEEGLRALGRMADGGAEPGSVANEEGLRALGEQIAAGEAALGGGKGGRRGGRPHWWGRHRRVKWALLVVGMVVVLLAAGGVGYGWYLNSELHRVSVRGLTDGPSSGKDAGTENILMVGSTNRCALKVQTPAYGLCTQGVTGINSDVVMILHLNPSVPSVSILSIPRDLFVPNARADGANKIDAALVEGPSQLVAAVQDDFAIPIQHYVELNFDSFAGVVTALGGITMYFPEPVFDAESGLNVRTIGCRHLDGVEALQVVRARHLQYKAPTNPSTTPSTWPQEAQSDLARIRRDHEFLRVLAAAVAKKGLDNPLTDQKLVSAVVGQLTVDRTFSAGDMVTLTLTYHAVNPDKAPELTLPVLVGQFGTYTYQGGHYGDIEFPTQPDDQSVVDQFLGVTADTNTMTGAPLPKPTAVTVSVLNGTDVTDQATTTADALGKLGFKIVGTGDTAPVGQEAETVVTYAGSTPADVAAAQLVARSLSGSVILARGTTTDGAQVTVTTGTDFSVDATAPAPAPKAAPAKTTAKKGAKPAATTTSAAATPTTAATGSTGSTGSATPTAAPTAVTTTTNPTTFAPPSAATQPLAAWDPRACTPSGGEGK